MNSGLSKEMQAHTYGIMNRVEDSHWWFVGRRAILESFIESIADKGSQKSEDSRQKTEVRSQETGNRIQDSDVRGVDLRDQGRAQENAQEERVGIQSEPAPHHSSLISHHPGLRILDVGCGTGANLEMLAEFGDAEGVDVSDEALTFCKEKGLKVHKGLAEELPFEDGSFDLVTGLDVVEHLDDDVAGLKEMSRVLKPGGSALIFVPAFMWLWGVQDDISHHRIRYTRKQIVERLEKAGFVVERATYANITFFAPILAGRILMRLTGIKPESENNVNISALNGIFGRIFGSERYFLKRLNFPFGVSVVVVARKSEKD